MWVSHPQCACRLRSDILKRRCADIIDLLCGISAPSEVHSSSVPLHVSLAAQCVLENCRQWLTCPTADQHLHEAVPYERTISEKVNLSRGLSLLATCISKETFSKWVDSTIDSVISTTMDWCYPAEKRVVEEGFAENAKRDFQKHIPDDVDLKETSIDLCCQIAFPLADEHTKEAIQVLHDRVKDRNKGDCLLSVDRGTVARRAVADSVRMFVVDENVEERARELWQSSVSFDKDSVVFNRPFDPAWRDTSDLLLKCATGLQ